MTIKLTDKRGLWTWRELIFLLILILVLVPIFIEYGLFQYLLNLFQNELYAGTLTGFIMSIIFLAGLYWIVLKPYSSSWTSLGIQPFSPKYWKFIIFWTLILVAVSVGIILVMEVWGIGTANKKTESLQSQMTLLNFIIALISACVVSPIYEEIFYRGFLYRFFSSRYGALAGMLISSIIFTIVHIPTFNTLSSVESKCPPSPCNGERARG